MKKSITLLCALFSIGAIVQAQGEDVTDSFLVPVAGSAEGATTGTFDPSETDSDGNSRTPNPEIHGTSSHNTGETCLFTLTAGVAVEYSVGSEYGKINDSNAPKYTPLNGTEVTPDQGLRLVSAISSWDKVDDVYTITNNSSTEAIVVYAYVSVANNSYNSNKSGYVYCTYSGDTDSKIHGCEEMTARKTIWSYGANGIKIVANTSITIGVRSTHTDDIKLWLFGVEATTSTTGTSISDISSDEGTDPIIDTVEGTISLEESNFTKTYTSASELLTETDEDEAVVGTIPTDKFTYFEFTSENEFTVAYTDKSSGSQTVTGTSIVITASDIDLTAGLTVSATSVATIAYGAYVTEYVAPVVQSEYTIELTSTDSSVTLARADLLGEVGESATYIVFTSPAAFTVDDKDATLDGTTYTYTLVIDETVTSTTIAATVAETETQTVTYNIHTDTYIPPVAAGDKVYVFDYDQLTTAMACNGRSISDSQNMYPADFIGLNAFLTLLSDDELAVYGIDNNQSMIRYSDSESNAKYQAIQIKGPALKFTINGEGTVTVAVASTGGSNTSSFGLFDGTSFIAATNANDLTAHTTTANTYEVTGQTYVDAYWSVSAGTYYIYTCVDSEANRGAYINYISVTDTQGTTAVVEYSCNDETSGEDTSGESDAISSIVSDSVVEVARYNILGQKIEGAQKGINIVKYSDGSSQKVLVK